LLGNALSREKEHSAYVLTPFDFFQSSGLNKNVKVVLVSASGSNKDIIMAYEKALKSDIPWLLAVCMKEKINYKVWLQKITMAKLLPYTPPTKKDGFLATNSLIVYMVLFLRAFGFFQKQEVHMLILFFDTLKTK
jgi:fructoselysine-6-P-deglycase FrlB-like protein